MPLFIYKAVGRDGETVEGERQANDEGSLLATLQEEGLLPIRITLAKSSHFALMPRSRSKNRLNQKQIGLFTRELLTLLQAGLPLDRALTVLLDLSSHDPLLNGAIARILEAVKGGAQLSDALEAQSGSFSRFYLNLIRAGEAGGAMEQVLERLADYLERSKELRDTVVTAMIYPAILVVLAVMSLLLLLTFVVPQFTEMFESAGKDLPIPTQIVVGAAAGIRSYWWLSIPLFAMISGYVRFQRADPVRRLAWDTRLLKIPLVGDLLLRFEVASFSRTLATLLSNGVSLLAALSIVKETLDNQLVAEKVGLAAESLKRGGGLAAPLAESEVFPNMAIQMIKLGEESGHLGEMLERVAITYDKEIRTAIQRLLSLMEPILIVGLGLMIGGIIISILMAILSVNDLAF